MIDPLARDGAARILSWTRQGSIWTTPLAMAVELPDAPAPAGRLALAREPRVRDTVVAGGSRFAPLGPAAQGFLVIDDDLPYAPASGADLVKAGHEENYLPAPLGPRSATTSPGATESVTPWSACRCP